MRSWKGLLVSFGALSLVVAGCGSEGSQTVTRDGNQLGLAGYQSVAVRRVEVATPLPWSEDKLVARVRDGTNRLISSGLTWSQNARPKAVIDLELSNLSQPSRTVRVWVGLPRTIDCTVRAYDAQTGAFLGEKTFKCKQALPGGGMLVGGMSGVALNDMYDRGVSGQNQDFVWLETTLPEEVVATLEKARRRLPPAGTAREENPATQPALADAQ